MTDQQAEAKRKIDEAVSAFNSATFAAERAGLEVLWQVRDATMFNRPVLAVTTLPYPLDRPEHDP